MSTSVENPDELETLEIVTPTVQRFFEISPIHGCSYIGFRSSTFEAIFWMIAILIGTGFFIHDLVGLSTKYHAETTAVSVNLQRNQTLVFSNAAVCFDVFRHHLADLVGATFIEQRFNQTLWDMSMRMSASSGLFDLSTFSPVDPDVEVVLKSAYLLIVAIVDYDLGTPGGGGALYNSSTSRAVELVDAFFKQLGYGYAQLSEQVARYMCKQAMYPNNCTIQVSGIDKHCVDICSTATVNWVGYTMAFAPFDDICFALNTPVASVFRTSADTFIFDDIYTSDMSILLSAWNSTKIPNLHGYGAPHLSFDMRGWRGLMDPRDMDSLAFIADGTGFLVGVEIQSQFLVYNHSWGTCGTLKFSECALFSCLPAARMAADGCWPLAGYALTSANKPPQVPVCGTRYANETAAAANFGTWTTCLYDKCTLPPCITFEYDYEVSLTSHAPVGVNATLYQGKLSYAVFHEYVSVDGSTFLAAVGGSLGLYLGGSLISIGHIPVFFVFSLISRMRKRRQQPMVEEKLALRVTTSDLSEVAVVKTTPTPEAVAEVQPKTASTELNTIPKVKRKGKKKTKEKTNPSSSLAPSPSITISSTSSQSSSNVRKY